MEIVLLLVAGCILWMVIASTRSGWQAASKVEQLKQRKRDLRIFDCIEWSDDEHYDAWEADFVAMRISHDRGSTVTGSCDIQYRLRRHHGAWQYGGEDAGKPWWRDVPEDIARPLESHYQRFMRQY